MRDMQDEIGLRQLVHLVKRFTGYVRAKPLQPHERDEVAGLLPSELADLFFSMQPEDQRHALDVYRRADSQDLAQAALLHDVGKSISRIGPISRSLATVADALHLPVKGGWRLYLDHGAIGADLLEVAGADDLAVEFTRNHPGPVPHGTDPDAWHRLTNADET